MHRLVLPLLPLLLLLSWLEAIVSLLVALFWGAAHALGPGHGKAVVTAYLVGTRGRARDALVLGGIVTVTHTIGVFTLGLVTLALSALIVPEQLYPWLNLVSAVLVVLVVWSFSTRFQRSETVVSFSEFLAWVDSGQVARVTITGNELSGVTQAKENFRTYAPLQYEGLANRLIDKKVIVNAKEPTASPWVKRR